MIPLGRLAVLFAILFSMVGRTTESGIQPMYLRGGGLFGKRVGGRYGGTVLPSAQIEEMKASEQAQTAAEPAGKAEEDRRGLTANDTVVVNKRSERDQEGSEKKEANESPQEVSASIRSVGDAKNTSDVSPQKVNVVDKEGGGGEKVEEVEEVEVVEE